MSSSRNSSRMTTPIKPSRLGPGIDTSASPLPPPRSAGTKLFEPEWLESGEDVWTKGRTRSSVSDASPLTPIRSDSGFGGHELVSEDMSIREEEDNPTELKREETHRRRTIRVSTPTHSETSNSPVKTRGQDAADLITRPQISRRGAVSEAIPSPIESPLARKTDNCSAGKQEAKQQRFLGGGSNDSTPKVSQRKPQKSQPHLQTDFTHNQSQGQGPYAGADSVSYSQFFSHRNFNNASTPGHAIHHQNPPQNAFTHFPPSNPGYSTYANPALGYSQGHYYHPSAGSASFTSSSALSYGYPPPLEDPMGNNRDWAATPMMTASTPYQPGPSMQMPQGQRAYQEYTQTSNALVPADGSFTGRLPQAPSQALTQMGNYGSSPFADNTAFTPGASDGVIKIGNIPYSSTKQDVWSALGKTAKVVFDCPIHIIMERSTAKTMDCYIEFLSAHDALAMIKKFDRMQEDGRPAKIGLRAVEYELSNQRELQKSLFPRAKCVDWTGGQPTILTCTDPYSTGFQGFFTREEMHQLVRHAEVPAPAPYSSKCPQRPYECIISTLYKFPWHATEHYTTGDRFLLFKSTYSMLKALCNQLRKSDRMDNLDEGLLRDLLVAAMKAPGIAEREKVILAKVVYHEGHHINLPQDMHEIYRVSPYANDWPFEVLGRKREGVDDQLCEFYFDILARGNYIKNGGTNMTLNPPRLQCYINHEDPMQNARTMAKEIELETELLFSIVEAYSSNPVTGNHVGYIEDQSEEDQRFNEGMQQLNYNIDQPIANMGTNLATSELLARRSQGGGYQLPHASFLPIGQHASYTPRSSSPMMPSSGLQTLPHGYQGHPRAINGPPQQRQGVRYPAFLPARGEMQGPFHGPFADGPPQTGPRSRR